MHSGVCVWGGGGIGVNRCSPDSDQRLKTIYDLLLFMRWAAGGERFQEESKLGRECDKIN